MGMSLTADYALLDTSPSATDAQLHAAYRNQLKLHHPDRHGGSEEATQRSQQIGAAYERILTARRDPVRAAAPPRARPAPPASPPDPETERRIAAMEAEVQARAERAAREATAARDRAKADAMAAAAEAMGEDPAGPPADTEDSLGRIFADTVTDLRERARDAKDHPAVRRAQSLIDAIDRLDGQDRRGKR
jgi:uncharacterized membrane protein YqiK